MRRPYWLGLTIVLAVAWSASECSDGTSTPSVDGGILDARLDRVSDDGGDGPSPDTGTCVPKSILKSLVPIPAGTFLVGSPVSEWGRPPFDQDQVQVTLTHAIELGATELTQAEWVSMCAANPSDKNGQDCSRSDCPVGGVNWFDAVAWLNALSQFSGLKACYKLTDCTGSMGAKFSCKSVDVLAPTVYDCEGYRLPTEFEWEYAYRAGTTSAFYSGGIVPVPGDPDTCTYDPNLALIGWYCNNSGLATHPVAGKLPNAWGLFDMSGNALEWTHSKYTPSGYGAVPLVDPPGTGATILYGDLPSMRGGIYNYSSRSARAATRFGTPNWGQGPGVGFRVARTLPLVPDAGIADAADAD